MSVTCFGVLGTVLRFALGKKVPAYRLVQSLIASVTGEDCDLHDKSYLVTHLLRCRRGFSNGEAAAPDTYTGGNRVSSILRDAPTADRAQVARHIEKTVLPLLDADVLPMACAALMRTAQEDERLFTDRAQSFARYAGLPVEAFLRRRAVCPQELIAVLLLYSVNCADNREGRDFVREVTRPWCEGSLCRFEGLSLLADGQASVPETRVAAYLTPALRRARFCRTVFLRAQKSDLLQFYVTNDVFTPSIGRIEGFSARNLSDVGERLYLEAEGGMGKSCMLRHLFVTAADAYPACGLPLLAEMRDYEGGSVLEYVARDAAPELTLAEVETLLQTGSCLLLLDGMDEIRPQCAPEAEKGISDLAKRYPGNRFVVSSRPCSRLGAPVRFREVRLLPLRLEQAMEMIRRLPEGEMEPNVRRELLTRMTSRAEGIPQAFTSNPLLLSILARTYSVTRKVPQDTYQFYNTAYDTLSVEHDRVKGYHGRAFYTNLDPARLLRVITLFSAYAYYDSLYSFTDNDLEKYCAAVRCRRREFTATTQDFLRDMTENLCLMVKDRGKYRFVHRTFQDFFASACFARQNSEALEQLRLFWRDRCPAGKLVGDRALFFLYDWEPDLTIRHVLLPTLDELTRDGFEGFVKREYPEIAYAVGETAERVTMQCESMVYAFIRAMYEKEAFVTLKNMPLLPMLIREACVEDSDGNLSDVEDYIAYQNRAEPLGYVLEADAREMYDNREEYIELIGSLAHRNSALRKEYERMRDMREKMRRRIADAPRFDIPDFLL